MHYFSPWQSLSLEKNPVMWRDIYRGQASPGTQLVKNPRAMQETPVQFLDWDECWKRDRLPTLVFLGFPRDLASKESACNAGDLG